MKFSPAEWLVLMWCGVKAPPPEPPEPPTPDLRYEYRLRAVPSEPGYQFCAEVFMSNQWLEIGKCWSETSAEALCNKHAREEQARRFYLSRKERIVHLGKLP